MRHWVILLMAGSLVAAPQQARAQPLPPPYRIGWISAGSATASSDAGVADFRDGMRDLGFVEGREFVLEYRAANGKVEKLSDLADELTRSKVDVIVASGEPAAFAIKRATSAIPVVAIEFGVDPVEAGLVASLRRPEANVTGIASFSEQLWPKRLDLLRTLSARLSLVAVLWNPANPGNVACLKEIEAGARALGLRVLAAGVSDGISLERSLAEIGRRSVDGLAICWDPVTLENARAIANFAIRRRVASVAPVREYVDSGALLSYGMNLPAHRRRAAYYVTRILKGEKPSERPVERPNNPGETVLNGSTLKALGLSVPPSLLLQLDDLVN